MPTLKTTLAMRHYRMACNLARRDAAGLALYVLDQSPKRGRNGAVRFAARVARATYKRRKALYLGHTLVALVTYGMRRGAPSR